MKLSSRALAVSFALIWGGAMFLVSLIHLAAPSYGGEFLRLMSSVYPGFHGSTSVVDLLVGTCYGLVDGALGGLVAGWLYNRVVRLAVTA